MNEHSNDTWQLWRQDDNGNRYLIATGSFEKLEKDLIEFESLGHKQMYWLEKLEV